MIQEIDYAIDIVEGALQESKEKKIREARDKIHYIFSQNINHRRRISEAKKTIEKAEKHILENEAKIEKIRMGGNEAAQILNSIDTSKAEGEGASK